ncbi:MAG: glycerophosphodiester phosphodiesterase family protein [Candidatus Competibacteraceae bacterium]|nr:glycerophosphodiester phosphodiesterase family protein [Candidatus Competibacteraceae bacterium]
MEIIAHRGASGHALENTLSAFRLAWAQGADGIELDVHLSRDRRLMVHHDLDTLRSAGEDHLIACTDSAFLRGLKLRHGRPLDQAHEWMPYLEEVLETVPPGRRVLVEIKCGPEVVAPFQVLLRQLHPALKLDVISFNVHTLAALHSALPALNCYPVFEAFRDGQGGWLPYDHKWIDLACSHGFKGLDPQCWGIDEGFVAAARAAGLELITWTVNDKDEARRLAELQIDVLTTDYPAQIRAALGAQGNSDGRPPAVA